MSDTSKRKKKKPIPARQIWEKLNLEKAALLAVQKTADPGAVQNRITPRLKELDSEIESERKKHRRSKDVGSYIRHGEASIRFFLDYPQYIPVMKQEIATRSQALRSGEDRETYTLNHPVLSALCAEQANDIFGRVGGNWSWKYRRIRTDYIETMERSCLAVEKALYLKKPIPAAPALVIPQKPSTPTPAVFPELPAPGRYMPPEPPTPAFTDNWKNFQRPSEAEVDHLLMNRCDDNIPDEEYPADPSTPSIAPEAPKLEQTYFPGFEPILVAKHKSVRKTRSKYAHLRCHPERDER